MITTPTPFKLILKRDANQKIAHASFKGLESVCLLPWAKQAILQATIRIAFEHLNIRALQVQDPSDLSSLGFQSASETWWVQDRSFYEKQQAYLQTPTRLSKKKRTFKRRHKNRARASKKRITTSTSLTSKSA